MTRITSNRHILRLTLLADGAVSAAALVPRIALLVVTALCVAVTVGTGKWQ